MKITLIPILEDNYAYLITTDNGTVGVIDPGAAPPILQTLNNMDLELDIILNTHHHWDHTTGNTDLINATGAKLFGPASEAHLIPGMDRLLHGGDVFDFGGHVCTVIATPGHTMGHVCFYFPDDGILFTGDTLFSLGCGRLFEGTPADMFASLQTIKALPDDTLIYCGHEYTESNGKFALSIDPDNAALQNRMREVRQLRSSGRPTLPVKLSIEKASNIYLRTKNSNELRLLREKKETRSQ